MIKVCPRCQSRLAIFSTESIRYRVINGHIDYSKGDSVDILDEILKCTECDWSTKNFNVDIDMRVCRKDEDLDV